MCLNVNLRVKMKKKQTIAFNVSVFIALCKKQNYLYNMNNKVTKVINVKMY